MVPLEHSSPICPVPLSFPFGPVTCPDGTPFVFPDNLFVSPSLPNTASPTHSAASRDPTPDSREPTPDSREPTPDSRELSFEWNELLDSVNKRPEHALPPAPKLPHVKKPSRRQPVPAAANTVPEEHRGRGLRTRKAPLKELHTLTTDENGVQIADARGNPIMTKSKQKSQRGITR
ncbi:hypothetical protein C0992_012678, partial [Termitomyces sp. T32_za158]